MPGGLISGGPSKRYRLPDSDGQVAAAEQGLAARTIRGTTGPVPPPAPLPAQFLDDPPEEDTSPLQGLGGPQGLPVEAPQPEEQTSIDLAGTIFLLADGVHVVLSVDRRQYVGTGASLVEALSLAAGELEVGLQQPVCPHCGQLMPTAEE